MSSTLSVPDDLDTYFPVQSRCGRHYQVHTKRLGLILDEIDCEGDAWNHIRIMEAADAERAAKEAQDAAEDADLIACIDAATVLPSTELRTLFAVAQRSAA